MSIGAIGSCSCDGPLQAWRDKLFNKADTNGDGKISVDEFSAFAKKTEGKKGAGRAGAIDTDPDSDGPDGPSAAKVFDAFDTDGDGSLSETELNEGLDAIHDAIMDAIKKHKAGHSDSLVDIVFGKPDDRNADDSIGGVDDSSTNASSSSTDNSAGDDLFDDNDADNSVDTNVLRLQQWMLDAFSSQFNVSSAFAQAA